MKTIETIQNQNEINHNHDRRNMIKEKYADEKLTCEVHES